MLDVATEAMNLLLQRLDRIADVLERIAAALENHAPEPHG